MKVLGICSNGAGAGKDEVANVLTRHRDVWRVSIADVFKRFVGAVFRFTEAQMWGPMALKNAVTGAYTWPGRIVGRLDWLLAWNQLERVAPAWLAELELPPEAIGSLRTWMSELELAARGIDRATGASIPALGISPRVVLQRIGTEWRLTQSENLWLDYLFRQAKKLEQPGFLYDRTRGVVHDPSSPMASTGAETGIVIPDVRYDFEARAVLDHGGKVVRVERPDLKPLPGEAAKHASEGGVSQEYISGVIPNVGTVEQLHWISRQVCGFLFTGGVGDDAGEPPGGPLPRVHVDSPRPAAVTA